jgi:hypothetical protein
MVAGWREALGWHWRHSELEERPGWVLVLFILFPEGI